VRTVKFRCMCGLEATIAFSDDPSSTKIALTHEIPICKRFDEVTNEDNGADYVRDCRLKLERERMN